MSNSLLTIQQITRKALSVLYQKLTFIGSIDRQYDNSYAKVGAKIGDTLKIRKPNRYVFRRGRVMQVQDTVEQYASLTVSNQGGTDMAFTSADLTLSLDDFTDRIIEPAMATIADNIEADALSMYKDVYYAVGTPGTTPATLKVFTDARARLSNSLAPSSQRTVHITPDTASSIVDALKGLFQDSSQIAEQYREGQMGRTAGFEWYENTLLPTHTNGNKVSGVQVNGASQTGTSLNIKGVANADTFTKGSVFTIAGVYEVHPQTRAATSRLQQFVVTADATMSTTTGTITISPSIITSGALQTVSASPADSAALTFMGSASTSYPQNIAHHKSAFTFATVDLELFENQPMCKRAEFEGLSMRIWKGVDINNDTAPCRVDVLYGFVAQRPELAVRIFG